MRKVAYIGLAAALSLLAMPSAVRAAGTGEAAATVTVEGTLLCAKCSLGEDREECQNAITVDGEEGATAAIYYLTDNEATKEYGHVCEESRVVRASGTATEEDGQRWLDATVIETLQASTPAEHSEHHGRTRTEPEH